MCVNKIINDIYADRHAHSNIHEYICDGHTNYCQGAFWMYAQELSIKMLQWEYYQQGYWYPSLKCLWNKTVFSFFFFNNCTFLSFLSSVVRSFHSKGPERWMTVFPNLQFSNYFCLRYWIKALALTILQCSDSGSAGPLHETVDLNFDFDLWKYVSLAVFYIIVTSTCPICFWICLMVWVWLCRGVLHCCLQYLSYLLLNIFNGDAFITHSGRLFPNLATFLTLKL